MQKQIVVERNPKVALTQFVGLCAGCGLFWWMKSIGLPGAGAVFWGFVLAAAWGLLDVIRAHRLWKATQAFRAAAEGVTDRYTTNKLPAKPKKDPDGWPIADE
ncbi:MAG: hypothetical protein EOM92_19335 [Gammaproteobacteria bacterium]|nr:hypothetical protein [Gammaproteobacteria bacterium]NCC23506.1 hypothetical protein [Alphaproteobacteria bacterium]